MTLKIEERLAKIRAEHKADVDRAVADPVFCSKVMTSPEYRNAHSSRAYLLTHIASLEAVIKETGDELLLVKNSREYLRGLLSRCESQCHRLMDRLDKQSVRFASDQPLLSNAYTRIAKLEAVSEAMERNSDRLRDCENCCDCSNDNLCDIHAALTAL